MRNTGIWGWIVVAALALSGCRSESPVELPPLTFSRYQPIYMDVANIEFVDEYQSPLAPPHVEHLMPYSPAEAMRIWVKERIRAVGADHTLQVIIKDGSVVSVPIRKESKLQDVMALNRDQRYDAKLSVELRVYGGERAMSESSVAVSASRSITIPEKESASRRAYLYRQMIADLMEIANAELEKNMFQFMSGHISYSHSP